MNLLRRILDTLDQRVFRIDMPGGRWFGDDEIAWLQAEFEWHATGGMRSS